MIGHYTTGLHAWLVPGDTIALLFLGLFGRGVQPREMHGQPSDAEQHDRATERLKLFSTVAGDTDQQHDHPDGDAPDRSQRRN